MLRLYLNKFFKLVKDLKYDELTKYINDSDILKYIESKNNFQNKWRKKTGCNISNEKYRIKKIKILNKNYKYKIYVQVIHSFNVNCKKHKKKSKEKLNYIIILDKVNFHWKLNSLICQEHNPEEYEKLYHSKNKYINLSKLKKNYDYLLENIDSLFAKYSKLNINYEKNIFRNNSIEKFNRDKAVNYARSYALRRNIKYTDFSDNGGDCTNFISQCLYAGGLPLSGAWKPYTNAWIRVNELYYYLLRKGFCKKSDNNKNCMKSSIIQFYANNKGYYSHSGIITEILENGDCLYCCHSYDKLDFPLSEVYPRFYDKIRIINVEY